MTDRRTSLYRFAQQQRSPLHDTALAPASLESLEGAGFGKGKGGKGKGMWVQRKRRGRPRCITTKLLYQDRRVEINFNVIFPTTVRKKLR